MCVVRLPGATLVAPARPPHSCVVEGASGYGGGRRPQVLHFAARNVAITPQLLAGSSMVRTGIPSPDILGRQSRPRNGLVRACGGPKLPARVRICGAVRVVRRSGRRRVLAVRLAGRRSPGQRGNCVAQIRHCACARPWPGRKRYSCRVARDAAAVRPGLSGHGCPRPVRLNGWRWPGPAPAETARAAQAERTPGYRTALGVSVWPFIDRNLRGPLYTAPLVQ